MKNTFTFLLLFAIAVSYSQFRFFVYNTDFNLGTSLKTKHYNYTNKDNMPLMLVSNKSYVFNYRDFNFKANKNYFYVNNGNGNTSDVYLNSNGNYIWSGFKYTHQPIEACAKIDSFNPCGQGDMYGALLYGFINMFEEDISISW